MDLYILKDLYLKIKNAAGVSPLTYTYYDRTSSMLLDFVGNMDSMTLSSDHITDYLSYLRTIPTINSVSVQTYARGARCFVSWLAQNDFCDAIVYLKFKLPKAARPAVKVLTSEEQKRLFACFDTSTDTGLRNFLICCVLFGSGLRRAEVCSIRTENVFEDYIYIKGKGSKERCVPITRAVYTLIQEYIKRTGKHEYLFLRSDGEPITISTVNNLFRRLKSRAKIPRLGMHLLRHSFATAYIENGGGVDKLSRILGHSSLHQTQRYVHASVLPLLRDFDLYTPLHF